MIKERILSAFLELSRIKGFYRVTMDELAAEAGLSKRTLYRYFHSKDEIIEAALDKFMAGMAVKIEELVAVQRTPDEMVKYILDAFYQGGQIISNPLVLDDLRQHYPRYWKRIDDFRVAKVQNIIRVCLNDRNKAYTRELDPRIVTTAVLAAIRAVVNPEFIITNGLTFEETVRQLLEFLQYGFMKRAETR
ncbi:MAG: TetR/AcrR family transcriptional regulator [Peptococcaceae bacterium]